MYEHANCAREFDYERNVRVWSSNNPIKIVRAFDDERIFRYLKRRKRAAIYTHTHPSSAFTAGRIVIISERFWAIGRQRFARRSPGHRRCPRIHTIARGKAKVVVVVVVSPPPSRSLHSVGVFTVDETNVRNIYYRVGGSKSVH